MEFSWQPGRSFPSSSLWERYSSEAVNVNITLSLFADDTTIIGRRDEIEAGTEIIKSIMNNFEEKDNDDKEEELIFRSIEGKKYKDARKLARSEGGFSE